MSFDPVELASKALAAERDIVVGSAKKVWSKTGSADFFDKPGVAVAETLQEGLLTIPLTNIGKISSWTLKGIGKVLWGTVKMGGRMAMLAPLPFPLPAGCNSVAEVSRKLNAVKDALAEKASGNPQRFGAIFRRLSGTIEDVQHDAQRQAVGDTALAA